MSVAGILMLFAWNQDGRKRSVIEVDSVMFGKGDSTFEASFVVLVVIVCYDK